MRYNYPYFCLRVMDYRDKVFLKVAERLSFSKAAEDLCISQPAVSKHIMQLETYWGVNLFERRGYSIRLTEAGKIHYSYLIVIQQQYRELEYSLGQLRKVFQGQLRLGVSSTIAQYVLPEVLAAFNRAYPQIRLQMYSSNSSEAEQMLLGDKVDMILVENAKSDSKLKYTTFMDDELVVIGKRESTYKGRKLMDLNTLVNTPIVLREEGSGTLEVISNSLKSKQLSLDALHIVLQLGSTESIKRFLVNFNGLAIVSERAVYKEVANNELQLYALPDMPMLRSFRFATKQGQSSQSVSLFVRFLENYNFKL